MSCSAATLDSDEGRYDCVVSGSQCMYLIPDSKRCAEEYGEGPDAYTEESKAEIPIMDFNKPNSNGRIYPKEYFLCNELNPTEKIESKNEIQGFSLIGIDSNKK